MEASAALPLRVARGEIPGYKVNYGAPLGRPSERTIYRKRKLEMQASEIREKRDAAFRHVTALESEGRQDENKDQLIQKPDRSCLMASSEPGVYALNMYPLEACLRWFSASPWALRVHPSRLPALPLQRPAQSHRLHGGRSHAPPPPRAQRDVWRLLRHNPPGCLTPRWQALPVGSTAARAAISRRVAVTSLPAAAVADQAHLGDA